MISLKKGDHNMRKCSKCKIEKEDSEFYKAKNKKSGFSSQCKQCESERKKSFKEKNPEHIREVQRKSWEKTKDKKNEKMRKKYHENLEKNRQRCRDKYWKYHSETRERQNAKNKTPEARQKANIRQKKWRKEKKELYNSSLKLWKKKNLIQARANQKLRDAIRWGRILKPEFCQNCGEKKDLQGHHEDYLKPLDVIWLCSLCHCHKHNKLMDIR